MVFHKFISVAVLAVVFVQQCADALPECLTLDAREPNTIDRWKDCAIGVPMFTFIDYKDIFIDPYDAESQFVMTNPGGGQFCIESEYAVTISSNFYSEVVYRIEMAVPDDYSFNLSLLNDENTLLVEYNFYDALGWNILDDWLMDLGTYKVGTI